jgi:hypothetical protein
MRSGLLATLLLSASRRGPSVRMAEILAPAVAARPGGVVEALLSARGVQTLARGAWADVLRAGDVAVDATCGNGRDAATLALLLAEAGPGGALVAIDVQQPALDATAAAVGAALAGSQTPPALSLVLGSHATFPPAARGAKLFVYNLGYLPGGDHALTTTTASTLASLAVAQAYVAVGGLISLMLYPGHAAGVDEADAVVRHLEGLDKAVWRVLVCRPVQNGREKFLALAHRRKPDPAPADAAAVGAAAAATGPAAARTAKPKVRVRPSRWSADGS